MNTKLVEELLENELKKHQEYSNNSRVAFLEFVKPYVDENNYIDFYKLESDGKLKEYNDLARESSYDAVIESVVTNFITSNSSIDSVDLQPVGFDLESRIQKAQEFEVKKSSDTADTLLEVEKVSKPEVVVGNNKYSLSSSSGIRERVALYTTALRKEVADATGTSLDTTEYVDVLQTACTNIVTKLNQSRLAASMVDEMASGNLGIDGQPIEQNVTESTNTHIMGFSMFQTMGFMASLATIGLAVFGTVFYFMTR